LLVGVGSLRPTQLTSHPQLTSGGFSQLRVQESTRHKLCQQDITADNALWSPAGTWLRFSRSSRHQRASPAGLLLASQWFCDKAASRYVFLFLSHIISSQKNGIYPGYLGFTGLLIIERI